MENPYESPKSDITVESKFKRSLWWKVYFFFITLIGAFGCISFLFYEKAGITEYIQLLLFAVSTAGLFGFSFLKKVFVPQFWLPYLIFIVLFSLFYEQLTNINLRENMSNMEFYISIAIGWLISIPAYVALYLYSKPDNPPWN